MDSDPGWKARSDILVREADRNLLAPLRVHSWTAEIERVERLGEYVVVTAERNGFKRRVALLYSTATDNVVYRRIEAEVDLTLFNGSPYLLEQFTKGLSRPVLSVDTFQLHLVEWNRLSAPDKLSPIVNDSGRPAELPSEQRTRRLLSETPIETIWSRLSRLKSAKLARKAVAERALSSSVELTSDALETKGDGVAYAIRNAADYFSLKDAGNVSQRILNLYYGCLSFAFAEMLAAPRGTAELWRIEDITKQGHGLWTHDGLENGFGDLAVGPAQAGFFPAWVKSMGVDPLTTMEKKPRKLGDLSAAPHGSWATMEQLFARIPEVSDLFEDVFLSPPAWISPAYDFQGNQGFGLHPKLSRPETSYILLIDESGRMSAQSLIALPNSVREITPISSGGRAAHFRAAVDHPNEQNLWAVLDVHRSPFIESGLILPFFGSVTQYRALCFTILYALSILVRYRPGLWRRVQEGDLDHMLALVEAFLSAVERIIPEQFLEGITGETVTAHQPGSVGR